MNEASNYIINRDKILGSGSFATVYLGVKTDNGLQCALKCSSDPLIKEVTIMKELTHKNIIQFYDSLKHFHGFNSAICMEYCNQGSLLDFANLHLGLCDNMFLKVVECLHLGLYYLRGKSLVHRDIKPGNIMLHRDNFGDYHVKLGDLGNAKKVPEGDKFNTLCGTLLYLSPDMLISHLRMSDNFNFKTSTDLWSVGITLYHAAIIELPFIPFSNHDYSTMLFMYLNKPPGVISGRQNSIVQGDFTWSKTLPESCQLSPMLNELASKLILNLLDLSDANSYDRFFDDATRLSQKKRIQVFNSDSGALQILYLDTLTYNSVSDQISQSMCYPKEKLLLLCKNKKLVPSTDQNNQYFRSMPIKGHTRYSLTSDTLLVVVKEPIINVPTLDRSHSQMENNKLLALALVSPSNEEYRWHKDMNYEMRDKTNKLMDDITKSIYYINHSGNYIECQIGSYIATAKSFNSFVLEANEKLVSEALSWQVKAANDTRLMTKSLLTVSKGFIKLCGGGSDLDHRISRCESEIKELGANITKDNDMVTAIRESILQSRVLLDVMEREMYEEEDDCMLNNALDSLIASAEGLVKEMKMLEWRTVFEDEDKYKLEIWSRLVQLHECFTSSKGIFDRKMDRLLNIHRSFFEWLKPSLANMSDLQQLCDSLHIHEDDRLKIRTQFLQICDALEPLVQAHDIGISDPELPSLEFVDVDSINKRLLEIEEIIKKMKKAHSLERNLIL